MKRFLFAEPWRKRHNRLMCYIAEAEVADCRKPRGEKGVEGTLFSLSQQDVVRQNQVGASLIQRFNTQQNEKKTSPLKPDRPGGCNKKSYVFQCANFPTSSPSSETQTSGLGETGRSIKMECRLGAGKVYLLVFLPLPTEAVPTGRWDCPTGLAWEFNR